MSLLDLVNTEETLNSTPLLSPPQQKLLSESYSSATVATRPEGTVANPIKPNVDASSATAERPQEMERQQEQAPPQKGQQKETPR